MHDELCIKIGIQAKYEIYKESKPIIENGSRNP